MGTRRGTEERAMAASALVRLCPDLFNRIASVARDEDLSVAAWLRAQAVTALGIDTATSRPSRARRPIPAEDVVAVAELRAAIGRAVGALVQTAARTRGQDQVILHDELEDLIRTFRRQAREIDTLKATLMASNEVRP